MNETKLIPIDDLVDYKEHLFKPYSDKRLKELMESVRESGILEPLIARPVAYGKFELLSGHNRRTAAWKVGLTEVPVKIMEGLTDDEARLVVTETNLIQRSAKDLSYSERANALIQHYTAAKNQGKRTDLINELDNIFKPSTSRLRGEKLKTKENDATKETSEIFGISSRDVSRYFKLKDLDKG